MVSEAQQNENEKNQKVWTRLLSETTRTHTHTHTHRHQTHRHTHITTKQTFFSMDLIGSESERQPKERKRRQKKQNKETQEIASGHAAKCLTTEISQNDFECRCRHTHTLSLSLSVFSLPDSLTVCLSLPLTHSLSIQNALL